ncbi:hypothetical protein CPB83DRAFT_847186 [Crepidotus variabilis]|uniref:Uncharacterized protein n=1 Tax=Crepidotus variabilis TaxID=179855 RepID=A0A9P6EPE0_9AGAR|nr:hypothetical protein CPB83DRAFT_847186 [Crepidotus variabilis]
MSLPLAARFRAIITGPLNTATPSIPDLQDDNEVYRGPKVHSGATKRKRDTNVSNPSSTRKVARRPSDDEGGTGRERTISFPDRNQLMQAMKDRFQEGPHVDFHGNYEVVDDASGHKARIQSVANEIWKATGYRFTVKDHPQFTNGHKTRFWCSQDEAHRSKSSRAARKAQGELYKPRQTSAGEVLAKNRFPCQSRLLVSSRDSTTLGRCVITVRMHHHVAHEPYLDLNLPPEIAQGGWGSGWFTRASTGAPSIPHDPNSPSMSAMDHLHTIEQPPPQEHTPPQQDSFDEIHHDIQELPQDLPTQPMIMSSPSIPEPSPPISLSQSAPPHAPTIDHNAPPDVYGRRMQAHIRNLREFCDGLEYQLQFNDYRMLHVLEREGGPFLELVADCLSKEGRLVPTEQSMDIPAPEMQPNTQQMMHNHNVAPDGVSIMQDMQMQAYDGNPGINPSALGC